MRHALSKRYKALCPYGEKKLQELVSRDIKQIGTVSVLVSIAIVWWNLLYEMPTVFYTVGTVILAIHIVYTEISGKRIRKTENSLYRELLTYLSRVKHYYAAGKNVANAVRDASEEMGEELRLHAALLYRILSEGERKEKVRNYVVFTNYNQYLKLFLVQTFEASEKGDIMLTEETSLLSENLEHLRLVVMEELYRKQKRSHEFAGYTFVSLVPVFAMPLLRQWGLEFAPELENFYRGLGQIVEAFALLVTCLIYRFINAAKEIYFFREREGRTRHTGISLTERLVKQLERSDGKFSQSIRMLLLQTGIRDTYGNFLLRMLLYAFVAASVTAVLLVNAGVRSLLGIMVGCFMTGICVSFVPGINLLYRKKLLQQQAEYEIKQFQSVILMERRMEDITIPEMLEDMEIFSQLFRRELRICINSYASGPEAALKRLKNDAGTVHEAFKELVEGFLAVDEVGVKKAFAEVENNRNRIEHMSRLESEIQIEKKRDGMDLLSKIPMVLTLGVYFIGPFFVVSLQGIYEVFEILEGLQV